jgi:predicted RNase H-like HicB family nuclease
LSELDIYTQGDTVEEALANLKEAAQLHIEEIGLESLKLRRIQRRKVVLELSS